jgi:hypothetical protein
MNCSAPKTNCFDEVVVNGLAAKEAHQAFDSAVEKRATASFFAGEEWKKVFPGLEKFPRQLEMLQKGLPLLRFAGGTKGLVRYVATRESSAAIVSQTRGKEQTPITGVEFALSVRLGQ